VTRGHARGTLIQRNASDDGTMDNAVARNRWMQMRVFLGSVVAAVIIAGAAMLVLGIFQRRADEAFTSSSSVSITQAESGHNLVGKDWFSPSDH
jgi:hypothetical protein